MPIANIALRGALRAASSPKAVSIINTGANTAGKIMPHAYPRYAAFKTRGQANAVKAWQILVQNPGLKQYQPIYASSNQPKIVSMRSLIEHYDVFLCDLYGVFENSAGFLPGAKETIEFIQSYGDKRLIFVSNTADRLPENIAQKYHLRGININPKDIYTSGMMLGSVFSRLGLTNERVLTLGNADSFEYVRLAGCLPVDYTNYYSAQAVVLAHPHLADYNEQVSAVVNLYMQKKVPIIVPNTDIFPPASEQEIVVAAGGMGLQIQAILERAGYLNAVIWAGKPSLYAWALEKLNQEVGHKKVLVVGDTLEYDTRGAQMAGVDSLLVLSGVHRLNGDINRLDKVMQDSGDYPTYILPSVEI